MKLGLIKFKHGEEIIAQYTDTGSSYRIQNCAALLPAEDFHWHLVTWMPYTTVRDGFTIEKSDVLLVANVTDDMKEYYEKWQSALKQANEKN